MAEPLSSPIRSYRGPALPALERLAPSPRDDLIAAAIDGRTVPGDIVVELHGRGGWIARGAVDRLRRAFDLEATALTRLVADLVLRPPDLRHLDAALNALATQPRGTIGLRDSINATFASHCAACGGPIQVDEYIWDTDASVPIRRSFRCGHCRDPRTGEGRSVPVVREDLERAAAVDPRVARERLMARFPTLESGHPLPGQLLDLYTPRTLDALGAIVERIETELRAPTIQAALRLAVAHVLLPGSRLNSYPGRVAALRVSGGRIRTGVPRQSRERNPWLLFEEGFRSVRAFVQRLEGASTGPIQARFGPDVAALLDGTANVVLRQGSPADPERGPQLPPERPGSTAAADARARVRLVLTQPPIHWTPENLGFAYLATSMALGADAATTLPLQAVFGTQPRGEWAWDAAALRRALSGVRRSMASDGQIVVLLDRTGPGGLVAGVLGGVGAGYRLHEALLIESGDEVSGTLEFSTFDRLPRADRDLPDLPEAPPGEPFSLAAVEGAVTAVAAAVLRARGEPARYERLLGEVLVGLDRMGHLQRLVGTPGMAADRGPIAAHEPGETPAATAPGSAPVPAEPPPGSAQVAEATRQAPAPAPSGLTAELVPEAPPTPMTSHQLRSWRDPARPVRGPRPIDPDGPGREPFAGVLEPEMPQGGPLQAIPSIRLPGHAPDRDRSDDTLEGAPQVDGPIPGGASAERVSGGGEPVDAWGDPGAAVDPVRLTLDIIGAGLRSPGQSRLVELEPGRWWLADPEDIEAARPPLSDRLEWAVFSLLSTGGGISEPSFLSRIAGRFRGHDTADVDMVRACLESYRSREPAPEGLIRTDDSLQARYEEHGALVGLITEVGHRLGLRAWISRREQRRPFRDGLLSDLLSDAEQRVYLPLVCPGPADALESVDAIWYLRGKASFLFEVEWTAMLHEPVVKRGGRIPDADNQVRFLVIPPERTELVRRKIAHSPLLRQRLDADNWHILKSNHLRRLHSREDATLHDLGPLLGLDPEIERQGEQLPLFA